MTWWAAVLGFVGALAGSWGGQLIASKREDRRWLRERDREDVRHAREIEVFNKRLFHDSLADWRSERVLAYQEFLDSFDDWWRSSAILGRTIFPGLAEGVSLPEVEVDDLYSQYNRLQAATNRLEIIGSRVINDEIEKIVGEAMRITSTVVKMERLRADGAEVDAVKVGNVLAQLATARGRIKDLARADVLVDQRDIDSQSNS
ncbi:hypothetical protein [Amycolatopsis sp. MtRt-6]|uniref:hypothetical protein n=1 Tax=Amycolatopsis sp. MtRt-6 TaxID=2792782 RepID=UPI001A8F0432|nr:hypothetical protein [Amycolatopsis sp. MtRt-6]